MKVKYDKKHDIAYIKFSSKKPDGAIEIKEGIVLDTTVNDELIGIEIFNASKKIPVKNLYSVQLMQV